MMKPDKAMLNHYMKFIELEKAGKMEEATEYFKKHIPISKASAKAVAEIQGPTYLKDRGYRIEGEE